MKLQVLGCDGGIGGSAQRTTALRLDDDILIDAGSGVGDLSLDALAAIGDVFLTHAHLDHIAFLPLLIDALGERRRQPLTVHAPEEVLAALRQHIFNDAIWPDFSRIPSPAQAFMRYRPLAVGEAVVLGGRTITALPVAHTVPAVGYRIDSGRASYVFSGDTGPGPAFWQAVQAIDNLAALIVECAFPDRERALAEVSRHFCPTLLAEALALLQRPCALYITHLKPGLADQTIAEIATVLAARQPRRLAKGMTFEF